MKFTNQDNKPTHVPEGDYIARVVGIDCGFSKGGKTAGAEMFTLLLEIDPSGVTVFDRLIDHPKCAWKLDTFLRSMGAAPAVGENWHFAAATAAEKKWRHIDVFGLRGWVHVGTEAYTGKDGKQRTKNIIDVYLTNKPKIERNLDGLDKLEPEMDADDDQLPF
jgi:hypothetical protein